MNKMYFNYVMARQDIIDFCKPFAHFHWENKTVVNEIKNKYLVLLEQKYNQKCSKKSLENVVKDLEYELAVRFGEIDQ